MLTFWHSYNSRLEFVKNRSLNIADKGKEENNDE
jgi:hypothetical protein